MKKPLLSVFVAACAVALVGCGGGSSSSNNESGDNVNVGAVGNQCAIVAKTLTVNGVTYTLEQLDVNSNGCIDANEIPSSNGDSGSGDSGQTGDDAIDADTNPGTVFAANISQPADNSYTISQAYFVGGSAKVTNNGVDVAQITQTDDSVDFLFRLEFEEGKEPAGTFFTVAFFNDVTASEYIQNGGQSGAFLRTNNGAISAQCTYDGTFVHTCEGVTLDNSAKYTSIPVETNLVILVCQGENAVTCTGGADIRVKYN